jgi:hypothetical protein
MSQQTWGNLANPTIVLYNQRALLSLNLRYVSEQSRADEMAGEGIMAKKSSKKRQKARQHKLARKKKKRSQRTGPPSRTARSRILPSSAGDWPLKEVWLAKEWQDTRQIIQVMVARRGPDGQIGVGAFVVDLGCLGVKNAYGYQINPIEYRDQLKEMKSNQKMVKADLNLVAKILREAIAYAESFGFKPHRDYRQAAPILGNADPDACDEEIPLGYEGKPLYISGPYDNVSAIMAKLQRAVGPDGFTYLAHLDGPPPGLFD